MSQTTTPTLTGLEISYTEVAGPGQGINIFLSSDLQGNISNTVKSNCPELDDQCFQSVRDLLISPNTELDPTIEPRWFFLGLAGLAGLLGLLIPAFRFASYEVPNPIYIPPAQVSQVSLAAPATEFVMFTGSGTPTMTITPKPEPTTITGYVCQMIIWSFGTQQHLLMCFPKN